MNQNTSDAPMPPTASAAKSATGVEVVITSTRRGSSTYARGRNWRRTMDRKQLDERR